MFSAKCKTHGSPWTAVSAIPPITHQGLFERVRQFQSPTKIRVRPQSHTSCPAQRRMKQGIGSFSKVMPSLEHLKEDGRLSHIPGHYLLSPAHPALRRKGNLAFMFLKPPERHNIVFPGSFIWVICMGSACLFVYGMPSVGTKVI